MKSGAQLGKEKGDVPLPGNEPVVPDHIAYIRSGMAEGQVREGGF